MDKVSTKDCTHCGEIKPLTDFSKDKATPTGYGYWCKQCAREINIAYKNTAAGKRSAKKGQLKFRYKLTYEEWEKLFNDQKACCAICGTHQSKLKRSLCIDHSHDTGVIRGLLCNRCNLGIAHFKEDAENCLKAYQYLRQRS